MVQFADDLTTPAVLGDWLVFGDARGQLHLVTVDEVRATLRTAIRSP